MDPRMLRAMQNLKANQIDAIEVRVKTADGEIVFDRPQVVKMNMMGQTMWQIIGEPREEKAVSEDDVALVVEKTGKPANEAREALAETGDLAEAIVKLSS